MSHQTQLSSVTCNSGTMLQMPPTHPSCVTNGEGEITTHNSLRAQVQPFQTYTPQQIQDQLQRLHIQQHNESESETVAQQRSIQTRIPLAFREGQKTTAEEEPSLRKETSNSVLHHLLSQSPKQPAPSSNPQAGHHDPHTFIPDTFIPDDPTAQNLLKQPLHPHDSTMEQSDASVMLSNIASHSNRDVPSFPVNVQNRQGSPTKGLGQPSPVHEFHMTSIAEGTTEEVKRIFGYPTTTIHDRQANGLEHVQYAGCEPGVRLGNNATDTQHLTHCPSWIPSSHKDFHQTPVDCITLPLAASPLLPTVSPETILHHISNVLNGNQIHYYQSNCGFVVDHDGVKFVIACNPPHFSTIQIQFIGGDPVKYRTLSSHLALQLKFSQ